MDIPIKELMRQAGITLSDVADAAGTNIPTVSRALDEELVKKVRANALALIYKKSKHLVEKIKSMEATEGMDAHTETQASIQRTA